MNTRIHSFLIIIVYILSQSGVVAQTTILHLPVVGDTIDSQEKEKYVLFDNIASKNYLFSVIQKNDTDTIITHYAKNDTLNVRANKQDISAILTNIERLEAYYNSLKDPKSKERKDYSLISNPEKIRLEDPNLKPGLQVGKKELKKEYKKGQAYKPFKATPIEQKIQRDNFINSMPPKASFTPR